MRQSTSRRSQPSKRQKTVQWTIVEPTLSSMLTPEQIAALNAAEFDRTQRTPRRVRPTKQCTVGYGYYPNSQQRMPTLRLRGRWLEQLGFAIGSKLRVTVRNRTLIITVTDEECMRRCRASK
ncbi:type I toxin-antitoxin system SymE family toxin [Xanthomonas prunicola]|uniref:SymE family type I addiction module toxin n=1 Tax=Xanthomonas prunicola TaxID=2053930 RepID=UPI0021B47B76|nr:type I toxin-antitoxin system SymE family toxin [Xanthomonas prunicola]UXA70857.1 type I toxin-antitoxin system SymE family toxin [Xanthomonas prunicola]